MNNIFKKTLDVASEVVIPALQSIGQASPAAIELVLGTGLHESNAWLFTHQVGGGSALGMWQMERATFNFLFATYLSVARRSDISMALRDMVIKTNNEFFSPEHHMLTYNHWLAAAMCRVHYLKVKEPLPERGDIHGQAVYWKKYYNTKYGKGNITQYIKSWQANVDYPKLSELIDETT